MNSFKNGRVRESGKPPIPGYAIATSCLSFFQSAETRENTTFVLILVPFGLEGYLAGFYTYPVAIPRGVRLTHYVAFRTTWKKYTSLQSNPLVSGNI